MENDVADTEMICIEIVDANNGGSGLASAITVNVELSTIGMFPPASKLPPQLLHILYPCHQMYF